MLFIHSWLLANYNVTYYIEVSDSNLINLLPSVFRFFWGSTKDFCLCS